MMKCSQAQEQMAMLLDSDAQAQTEDDALAAHVSDCEDCQSIEDDLRLLMAGLREAPAERAPEG